VSVDDATLWERVRDGDTDAFGDLFERHARVIHSYCFRRTGDWSAAEDLVSVVFLEVWRRRNKELSEGKVLPWLFGVATNVVRNHRRARTRYAAALRRVPEPRPQPDFSSEVDARIDDERRMKPLLELVSRLPKREQDVFTLAAWFDLSYEDIAVALGVRVGTVRSRLSRARKRLRELDPDIGHAQRKATMIQEALEP
jgi:RNA polymerase sigma factor (sigma-70 family)